MKSVVSKVLIAGQWRESQTTDYFQAENPSSGELLPERYPVSPREEVLTLSAPGPKRRKPCAMSAAQRSRVSRSMRGRDRTARR